MIAVDASALVAILLDEPEKRSFLRCLASSDCRLSPLGYWEAHTRLHSLRGQAGVADLDALMSAMNIQITPAGAGTARLATQAQITYGKGTPARLNLGDCFAYALAKENDLPLLYKGDDFSRTDARSVLTD